MGGIMRQIRHAADPLIRRLIESRFVALTIWKPGLFGTPPIRMANFYRIALPVFDLILISIGARAIRFGVPAFDDVTGGDQFGDRWGTVLLVAAIACLFGIVFPKLFVLELWGKIVIFAALVIYAGTVQALAATDSGGGRAVVASMVLPAVLICLFRLGDIATERRLRKRTRAAAKAAHA